MKSTFASGIGGGILGAFVVVSVLCSAGDIHAQTELSSIAPTSRVFLLPTANPIGGGHGYLSVYELFFLYGGFGIGDVVSISGGMTLIPGLGLSSQASTLQAKFTVVQDKGFAMALGGNIGWITAPNQYTHLFGNMSILIDSAWYTLALFYKMTGPDEPYVNVMPFGNWAFRYSGGLGVALGAEWALRNRTDMHYVAELWNSDISNPRSTAIFGGLRIGNDMFTGSFGLVFAASPIIFPAASFAYEW